MTFKEFYFKRHPKLLDWGTPGELIQDVYVRMSETLAEYIDYLIKEKLT